MRADLSHSAIAQSQSTFRIPSALKPLRNSIIEGKQYWSRKIEMLKTGVFWEGGVCSGAKAGHMGGADTGPFLTLG